MTQLGFDYDSPPAPSPAESLRRGKAAKRDAKKRIESIESDQCQAVLKHVRQYPETGRTRQEIADDLRIRLSSVCGRVKALIDAKKLYVGKVRREGKSVVYPIGY